MGFVPDVAVAVPLAFVCGAAGVLYFTPTTAIVQMEAEPTMHGRLLALQVVFMVGAGALGGLALGGLADVVGSRAPVVISGLVCVAVGVWGALAIRRTAGRSGRGNPVRRPDRQPSEYRPTQFRAALSRIVAHGGSTGDASVVVHPRRRRRLPRVHAARR
jgi:MFS family permease